MDTFQIAQRQFSTAMDKDAQINLLHQRLKEAGSEITRLEVELREERARYEDAMVAKSTLANKISGVGGSVGPESRMFGVSGGGAASSAEYINTYLGKQRVVPELVDLDTPLDVPGVHESFKIAPGQMLELPSVLVECERFDLGDMEIRCGKALGKGGHGKVIAGEILRGSGAGKEVAIKAVMKHGSEKYDRDFYREASISCALSNSGLVPAYMGAIETPKRFLLMMVSLQSYVPREEPNHYGQLGEAGRGLVAPRK